MIPVAAYGQAAGLLTALVAFQYPECDADPSGEASTLMRDLLVEDMPLQKFPMVLRELQIFPIVLILFFERGIWLPGRGLKKTGLGSSSKYLRHRQGDHDRRY